MSKEEKELIEEVEVEGLKNYNPYTTTPEYTPTRLTVWDKTFGKKRRNLFEGRYNSDVTVPQNPVLRFNRTNVLESSDLEVILEYSHYLEKNCKNIIEEIFERGWDYEDMNEDIEWSPELQDNVIEMAFKGLITKVSLLRPSGDGRFWVFTSNDIYNRNGQGIKVGPNREITDIQIFIPNWLVANQSNVTKEDHIWFRTQYSSKPQCVLYQPYRNIRHPLGMVKLIKQVQSALEKMYLRDTELLFLSTGGVVRNALLPQGTKDEYFDAVKRDIGRGLRGFGSALRVKNKKDMKVDEIAKFTYEKMPMPDFDVTNSHISEDSPLSKQNIEGEAASGAMGGVAPESNERKDAKVIKVFQKLLAPLILDINEVIFGVQAYELETTKTGFKIRKPLYKINFKEPEINQDTLEQTSSDIENGGASRQNDDEILNNSIVGKALLNSISDEFVTYRGNMFMEGWYGYPELGRNFEITKDKLQKLANKDIPGRSCYLEPDHQDDFLETIRMEGIGNAMVVGTDFIDGRMVDVTELKIKKNIYDKYPKIFNNKYIYLSPRYVPKMNPETGEEEIVLINCAVMFEQSPRSSFYGLSTKAKRILNNAKDTRRI